MQFEDVKPNESLSFDKLQQKVEELERFFSLNLDLLCIADLEGNFLKVNEEWSKTLGYSVEFLETQKFLSFVHPDDILPTLDVMSKLGENTQVLNFVNRYRCHDGSYKYIEWRSQPYDTVIYAAARDITEKIIIEQKSREREDYLRTILETTQDGFLIIGDAVLITDVNEAYCRMTGFSRDEIIGMPITNLDVNETLAEIIDRINGVVSTGHLIFETRHKRKDGTIFDVEASVTSMSKSPLNLICFCRDVSERKNAEKMLSHSYELMRYIIEHNRSAVAVHDENLNYLYVSQPYLDSYRVKENDIIGKNHYDVFPDLPQKWRDAHQRALNGEIVIGDNDPYLRSDGYIDWTRWECRPWYKTGDTIGGIIVYTEVINEQKELEQLIFNEKEQFKTTLLSVGDAVISTDKQSNVIVMNKIAENLTGWTMADAYGKPLNKIFRLIHEKTRETCRNPASEVIKTGAIHDLSEHTMLISKTGREIPIGDSAAPIRDREGNTTGAVIVFRDFTEKREKQKQVEYLSFHDHLTGLYNRGFFEEELRRLDSEKNLPLTLVMLDVNGLKLINDAFGHKAGDELLIKVSKILKTLFVSDEIISRTGGDEFIILLTKITESQTIELMKSIKHAFNQQYVKGINISVAIGSGTKVASNESIELILKAAEDSMYRDKISDRSSQRNEAIKLIMRTLYEKTPRELQHSKRVSDYCKQIGIIMNLGQSELNDLVTASELHDIGKIAINNDILDKTEPLSKYEWLEIKRHPEIGYNILSSVNAYAPLAEIVLAHHERVDGNGYPKGLKGQQIPILSRIISVADTYDAMTEDRPYRKAMSKNAAINELQRCAGTQLDADITDILINHVI